MAAPIRNEWLERFLVPGGLTLLSVAAKFVRVRNLPSWNLKSGPDWWGEIRMYSSKAWTGQSGESFLMMRIVVPTRKGSVFEAFILMSMVLRFLMRMSDLHRVVAGSYDLAREDVYSEILKNP